MDRCEFDLNTKKEIYEFGKVAKQSNGAVLLNIGKAVILATVVSEFDNPVEEDFIPLTVQYVEKSYAAAKIPGGFIKRESKPSEFETLTSRIVDRSLRPLFPKGFVYPTTITVIVLSSDEDVDLQVFALNAASAALYYSDLPIQKSVCGVRVGLINNNLVINPTLSQLQSSSIDLYLAGTKDELLMIEMKASSSVEDGNFMMNEVDEDRLLDIIEFASNSISHSTSIYEKSFANIAKEIKDVELITTTIDTSLIDYVRDNFTNDIKNAIKKLAKSERAVELKLVAKDISNMQYCTSNEYLFEEVYEAVSIVKKEIVRDMIVSENTRADGRGLKDVRPISIETNILPSAHSSCLFTRGETQALVVATIGGEKDAQQYDLLTSKSSLSENFMVHYNFPGFSVGEAKPMFAPGRRELGHGNLAKRALECSIDSSYTNTIRLVSEILESNGSSSMATVCGGSLALKAANIPTAKLVAGVAMGLIVEDDKYAVLSDIMGLEDHDGDMDFKVTGSSDGITALQMDIKLGGVELSILKEALYQAKEAREHILSLMKEASNDIELNTSLPTTQSIKVDSSQTVAIIGKGGSVIKELIENFNVSIDIDRDNGNVKVTGLDQDVSNAIVNIRKIVSNNPIKIAFDKLYSIGDILDGKVERITDFGAFVSLPKGGEGLLHISKISKKRINSVRDILDDNQELKVKVLAIKRDRIELSLVNL